MVFYPNFSPLEWQPISKQHAIEIPSNILIKVFRKIFRGAEYILNGNRVIENQLEPTVYIGEDILKFEALNISFDTAADLGPLRIQRLAGKEVILYKAIIWRTLIAYGSIEIGSQEVELTS